MSWSVSAVGKSDAVAKKLAADFSRIKVSGPEIQVVEAAASAVAIGLAAQIPACAVQVSASGSQSTMGSSDGPTSYTNTFKLDIQPIYGWVE